ncbi:MAG: 16S rRNA (adenine(1518)-N(6)/adenine(1519)-N(6))-dimethyltransferase RsmA [Acidobacteria bacterium]|nr:16S rRNA (adenine(1518)-N(6)/adenine(1519)-N(6))-dimethyltransferase RsmA [Acidobacteriota bacterium]
MKAKKSLGQNFLIDERVSQQIIDAVRPKISDIIVEIGPGTGALTQLLVDESGLVVAVELDARLIERLRREIREPNFHLVEADALKADWNSLLDAAMKQWREFHPEITAAPRLRVVANLPYYISTPIMERLLQLHGRLFDLTLMLQEEVVDRIASRPGGKDYGYLSVLVQYFCMAEKLFAVPPEAFSPVPKVHSAIVQLIFHQPKPVEVTDEEKFFAVVRAAFAQRRKTILNNLKAAISILHFATAPIIALENSGIDAKRRAETLALAEFAKLYAALFFN